MGFSAIPCFALAALNIPRRYVEIKMEIAKAGGSSVRLTLFGQACKNTNCSPARLPFQFNHGPVLRSNTAEGGWTWMNTDSIAAKELKDRKRSSPRRCPFRIGWGEGGQRPDEASLEEWSEGQGEESFSSSQSRHNQRPAPAAVQFLLKCVETSGCRAPTTGRRTDTVLRL